MQNYMASLNADQLEAVETTEGYVRVIAGAGSGKTRALTCRFMYLVDQMGVSPANILCVTFTNKAAKEMKNRIHAYLGDLDLGMICTFHGFCVKVLKEDGRKIGYPRNFTILDDDDQETILKKVYDDCGYKTTTMSFKDAKKAIGTFKIKLDYIHYFLPENEYLLLQQYEQADNTKARIIFGYLYEQRKNFALDFQDLIKSTIYIFQRNEDVLSKWQKRLEYIMVDEFQDVSLDEALLCSMLSKYHQNLFVVGDPDQTIYTFRKADIKIILDFDKTYPGTKTIMMNTNYRSTKDIIDASNSLISKNTNRIEKQLTAVRGNETLVVYNHTKSVQDEMEWITQQIELLIQNGVPYSAIAVLYRAHHVTRELEEALVRHKMPYVIYSGIPFYSRKEIKDVLSYLRMLISGDDLAFLRTINEPKRNFGKKRISILEDYQKKNGGTLFEALKNNLDNDLIAKSDAKAYVSLIEKLKEQMPSLKLTDLFKTLMRESGYEDMLRLSGDDDRLENVSALEKSIVNYENKAGETFELQDYLSEVALYTNADKEEKQKKISLMTVHTAKGLEFPYVFVCAMNEGIFPSSRALTKDAMEEERRLAYVAFTRAKNALFISEAEGTNFDFSYRYPSRFIFNIDKALLKYTVELDEKLVESAMAYVRQREGQPAVPSVADDLFDVGSKVEHRVWGKGEVVGVKREESCYEIKWDKFDTTRHISFTAAKSIIVLIPEENDSDLCEDETVSDISQVKDFLRIRSDIEAKVCPPPEEYDSALKIIYAENPALERILDKMQYAGISEDTVQVLFTKKNMMPMKIAMRKADVIEKALSDSFGQNMSVQFLLLDGLEP